MLERVAVWIWRRWSRWWTAALVSVLTLLVLLTAAVPSIVTASAYLRLDRREFLVYLLFTLGIVAVAFPAAFGVLGRQDLRVLSVWRSGDRSNVDAVVEAAFDSVHRVMWRGSVVVTVILSLTVVPFGASLADERDPAFAALALAMVVVVQWARAIVDAAADLLLRPLREELSASTPDLVPAGGRSIASRMAVAAFLCAWVCGITTGAVIVQFDTPSTQLAAGAGVPVVLGALYTFLVVRLGVITPSLRPLDDLISGTQRVAVANFGERVAVTSNNELGRLVASFNRMQVGLGDRERLYSAFGSYVDPALAERLLGQADELFSGERISVTVMFADVRDFTSFAESNTAEDTVSHLNALFEIVVEATMRHGGHVNKFLGDGAMVIFGAPDQQSDHADRAVDAAVDIQRQVSERFDETVRLGIGINTGTVIAGTIGSTKKLEFTVIGDAVNVAARVEQLTKTTGDATLLTQQTLDALTSPPVGLTDRGAHEVKGKERPVAVYALDLPTIALA